MERAVIYVRQSLDRGGEGLGIARQEAACREACERYGWEVVAVYSDNDTSATSGRRRPGYERALAAVTDGEADVWVSWAYDRVMRRLGDLERFLDTLTTAGARAHFIQAGGLDLGTPAGQAMAGVFVVMAKMETDMKSQRQQAAERQRANAGRRRTSGVRPFGWNDDRLTLHPIEAPALRNAINDVIGGRSLRSILGEWNADPDLRPQRAEEWVYSSLTELLTRPANAGIAVYRRRLLPDVETEWEPIVSRETHETICAILANPARRRSTTNVLKHYLSGAVLCGVCGERMFRGAVNIRGSHRPIFRCKAGTGHATRSAVPIEEAVSDAIVERLSRKDAQRIFRPKPNRAASRAIADVERLRLRLAEMEADYAAGHINGRQLQAATETIEEQIAQAQAKTVEATTVMPEAIRKASPTRVRAVWESLSPSDKRTVCDALLTVTLYPRTDPEFGSLPYGCRMEWK